MLDAIYFIYEGVNESLYSFSDRNDENFHQFPSNL